MMVVLFDPISHWIMRYRFGSMLSNLSLMFLCLVSHCSFNGLSSVFKCSGFQGCWRVLYSCSLISLCPVSQGEFMYLPVRMSNWLRM